MHIPRHIPFCTKIKFLAFTNVNTLVSGIFLMVGLIMSCMMPVSCVADVLGAWRPAGKGVVSKAEPSELAEIYKYGFSGVADKDQAIVTGYSYDVGGKFEPDQNVILCKSNFLGEKWKIEGASFSSSTVNTFPNMLILAVTSLGTCLFLFTAFGLWYFGAFRLGLRRLRVMRTGEIAEAEFLDSERLNVAVNSKALYRMRFEFAVPDGQKYVSVVFTTAPDELMPDRSQTVLAFYDPGSPENNDIPSKLKGLYFDRDNGVFTYSAFRLAQFLIPGLFFAGIIGLILHTLAMAAIYGSIVGR